MSDAKTSATPADDDRLPPRAPVFGAEASPSTGPSAAPPRSGGSTAAPQVSATDPSEEDVVAEEPAAGATGLPGAAAQGGPTTAPLYTPAQAPGPAADVSGAAQWPGAHPPLVPQGAQPGEKVGPLGAVRNFFRRFFQFSGRASRSEFWWMALIQVVLTITWMVATTMLLGVGSSLEASNPGMSSIFYVLGVLSYLVFALVALVILIPWIALTVRRLHDTSRSGWWYFIALVPLVGNIILIVFLAERSHPEGAAYYAR